MLDDVINKLRKCITINEILILYVPVLLMSQLLIILWIETVSCFLCIELLLNLNLLLRLMWGVQLPCSH